MQALSISGNQWQTANGFVEFLNTVIIPYTVGGLVPGFITAVIMYFVSKPLIVAYQNRRKGRLRAKFNELREARARKAELKRLEAERANRETGGDTHG